MDIKINFINQSNDTNNSQIVIFQKNMLGGIDEIPVAWKVLDCPPGHAIRFVYPDALTVSGNDEAGNATPPQPAKPGQAFAMRRSDAGNLLAPAGPAGKPGQIDILHEHGEAPVGARFYRGGNVVATRQTIMPRTRAEFLFKPILWIGVAARAKEGLLLPPAAQAGVTTPLSLEGMHTADIVMTGGGPGAEPLRFMVRHSGAS